MIYKGYECKDDKCGLGIWFIILGIITAAAAVAVLAVKLFVLNGRDRYSDCYHCECDDTEDDDFEDDEDDDFVDDDDDEDADEVKEN